MAKPNQPLDVIGSSVLEKNMNAKARFVVNQGGTRSGKTYSILQTLIIKLFSESNIVITIARKTFPALRATAMRDFFEILKSLGVYDGRRHNKSQHTYKHRSNLVEFVSLDSPQKKRGAKRHYQFMNEVNEFTWEDFQQLNMRTERQIFMDYNPSDIHHWVFDKILTRDDAIFIKSTYKDNPFLPAELVAEIERLKIQDETYWKIYGLGERAAAKSQIYTNWQISPFPPVYEDTAFGLDFGYNNPTAFVQVALKDRELYIAQRLYEARLTNSDLIKKFRTYNLRHYPIYADAAEPQRIEELRRAGFNCKPANKDVMSGITFLKSLPLHIDANSAETIKEFESYKWLEDANGDPLDKPLKFNDHAVDATRYAAFTHGVKYWNVNNLDKKSIILPTSNRKKYFNDTI